MPYLKTLIRMEEYDRSLTRTQQLHRDTQLAKPRTEKVVGQHPKDNSWQGRSPQWGNNRVDMTQRKVLPPSIRKAVGPALQAPVAEGGPPRA